MDDHCTDLLGTDPHGTDPLRPLLLQLVTSEGIDGPAGAAVVKLLCGKPKDPAEIRASLTGHDREWQPLHHAAAVGKAEVVEELIRCGACVNVMTS